MADEDAFQAAIDQDRHVIPIFCDWLADRNDPREEGYRTLYAMEKRPWSDSDFPDGFDHWYWRGAKQPEYILGNIWHPVFYKAACLLDRRRYRLSRRACDDMAALAWLKLSAIDKANVREEAMQWAMKELSKPR